MNIVSGDGGGLPNRLVYRRSATLPATEDALIFNGFFVGDLNPLCTQSIHLEVDMKMVKSLVLGSAAALVAMGGAQAADLPVKAKAVEYVRICSLYGAGFYYIPGTDTCIKLGGYLRMDVLANTNSDNTGNMSGAGAANNRMTHGYLWRSREDLNIDTRTATEYGVVRTYFDATFTWTDDQYTGNGNGTTTYSSIGGVQAPNNANAGAGSYGT